MNENYRSARLSRKCKTEAKFVDHKLKKGKINQNSSKLDKKNSEEIKSSCPKDTNSPNQMGAANDKKSKKNIQNKTSVLSDKNDISGKRKISKKSEKEMEKFEDIEAKIFEEVPSIEKMDKKKIKISDDPSISKISKIKSKNPRKCENFEDIEAKIFEEPSSSVKKVGRKKSKISIQEEVAAGKMSKDKSNAPKTQESKVINFEKKGSVNKRVKKQIEHTESQTKIKSKDALRKPIGAEVAVPVKRLNVNKRVKKQNDPAESQTKIKSKDTLRKSSRTEVTPPLKPVKKIRKLKSESLKSKASTSQQNDISSDSCDSDLEDVDELDEILNVKSENKETVQIELESTNVMWGMTNRKKKSRNEQIQEYLRREINRSIKEVYENMHKTHILCLIAHGRFLNSTINSENVLASALSIVPKNAYPGKRLNIKHLQTLLSWFFKKTDLTPSAKCTESHEDLESLLISQFKEKVAYSEMEAVLMFIAVCRVLGITARLVMNLVPVSWKPSSKSIIRPAKKKPPTPDPPAKMPKVKKMNSKRVISSDSEEDIPPKKQIKKQKSGKSKQTNSEDEFEEDTINAKKTNKKTMEAKNSKKKFVAYWVEVFCEEEERWLSVEVLENKIHFCPEFHTKLAPNSIYILAFNPDLSMKDVTMRYITSYLSSRDKLRLDNDWWESSISPFKGIATKKDKAEDAELQSFLNKQPLPKKLSEYKNHPLYALQRHLLKFEAIYPPDAEPVGYFRGEPVFPRECVKTLSGRERWIHEGKVIKVGEEPYKIVKGRPKWDRNTCTVIKDIPLPVFGDWQIEDYEPPTASNGKVPRNEYGNVELFKLSMLPKGCVYLQLPGLNKVARKLHIDCATALTGFDFHGGWNHPVYDGFVVCEEFEDALRIAWDDEQEAAAKRQEENRVRKIYQNWKTLIKGMLVRNKIWKKYGKEIVKEQEEKQLKKQVKPKRKKIKQEDISSLEPIPETTRELGIDFESSAADLKKGKTFDNGAPSAGKYSNLKVEESESSEEDESTKQEKIKSILNWNPKFDKNEPNLSDESEDESEKHDKLPIKDEVSTGNLSKKESVPIKKRPKEHDTDYSSDSCDFEPPVKKRPRRSTKKKSYAIKHSSDEDFDDSDIDKDFQPDS